MNQSQACETVVQVEEVSVVIQYSADGLAIEVGRKLRDGWRLHGDPYMEGYRWIQFLKRSE